MHYFRVELTFLEQKGLRSMSDSSITLQLEIPPEIAQQDVWNLEERCKQVVGVTTDLQESRDFIVATLLFIQIVGPYIGQAAVIAGGVKATHDLARIFYDFLHPAKQEKTSEQGKNKVVIVTKRKGMEKRIELYNLSLEEIERVLEQ